MAFLSSDIKRRKRKNESEEHIKANSIMHDESSLKFFSVWLIQITGTRKSG
jgi:hypothetical protein